MEEVMSATGVEEMSLAGGGCRAWAFSATRMLGLDSTGPSSMEHHPANSICLDLSLFSSSCIFLGGASVSDVLSRRFGDI